MELRCNVEDYLCLTLNQPGEATPARTQSVCSVHNLTSATVETARLLHLSCFSSNLSVRGGASTYEHLPFSYLCTYRLKDNRYCEIISFRTVSMSGGDYGNEQFT